MNSATPLNINGNLFLVLKKEPKVTTENIVDNKNKVPYLTPENQKNVVENVNKYLRGEFNTNNPYKNQNSKS